MLRRTLNNRYLNSSKFFFKSIKPCRRKTLSTAGARNCSESEGGGKTPDNHPSLPTTCCMSGCANCVWLDYAEDMVQHYHLMGEEMDFPSLLREVQKNIDDPMIKAFITMELKSKYVFKKS